MYEIDDIKNMVPFLPAKFLTLFIVDAPLRAVRLSASVRCPWVAYNIRFMKKVRNEAVSCSRIFV